MSELLLLLLLFLSLCGPVTVTVMHLAFMSSNNYIGVTNVEDLFLRFMPYTPPVKGSSQGLSQCSYYKKGCLEAVPRAQKKKTQARANCSAVPTQLALCLRLAIDL